MKGIPWPEAERERTICFRLSVTLRAASNFPYVFRSFLLSVGKPMVAPASAERKRFPKMNEELTFRRPESRVSLVSCVSCASVVVVLKLPVRVPVMFLSAVRFMTVFR